MGQTLHIELFIRCNGKEYKLGDLECDFKLATE